MKERINQQPTPEKTPEQSFEPISETKVNRLKSELSTASGIDFNDVPVDVIRPSEPFFDFVELRIKIFAELGNKPAVAKLFSDIRGELEQSDLASAITMLRTFAQKQNIQLDGSLPGLVYTIQSTFIVYPVIPRTRLLPMAQSYARKERLNREITSTAEAEKLLTQLAEKYFFHEIGHLVYQHLLNESQRQIWQQQIDALPDMAESVRNVQNDNVNRNNLTPKIIANEAFADTFTEVISAGRFSNRLGQFPDATKLNEKILLENGFHLPAKKAKSAR